MKFKNLGKIFLGPFITTVIVLTIIIISVVFAAISQTNGNVRRSTEEHAIADMKSKNDDFASNILFSLDNGIDDLDIVLDSNVFTYRIVFVTDSNGNIVAESELAKYTFKTDNLFRQYPNGKYYNNSEDDDEIPEENVRALVNGRTFGSFIVEDAQREYFVFRPLGNKELTLFYMLHQDDVERLYTESEQYLKSVKALGVAYISATVAIVFLMCSYILSVAKSSELKIKMSNMTARDAKEQARTYSDITRVLSQSYEKIFYVNLKNDHYKVFTVPQSQNEATVEYEGENFWSEVCREIIAGTIDEDRLFVEDYFDKELLPELVRRDGSKRIRFRMNVNGAPQYYYMHAYPSESEGDHYLIIGLKNIDATVAHDIKQLAEKEAALRRVDIYRRALMENMIAYLEVNLTDETVIEGPYIVDKKKKVHAADLNMLARPVKADELAQLFSRRIYPAEKEQREYQKNNSCSFLISQFEAGHTIVESNYDCKWFDGANRDIRQNYYMTRREEDGSVVALCVLYDMTEKVTSDRQIRNLTEELLRSRIKISTGQMQPHFLYNVLGSIREIILEDPAYAADLMCDFTTHLRACIKSLSNDDLIPFPKEIENIKAYVNIERMRFGDRMKVEFDIRCDDFDVVPLSIQPIVENAIRHGLYPKKDEQGIVRISSFVQNEFVVIVVKDNGVGFDYEKISEEIRDHKRDSTGLLNLTLRLEKVMNAKVYFDSKIGEGTTVTVLIPEKKKETDYERNHS